jgi:hypothetical protein
MILEFFRTPTPKAVKLLSQQLRVNLPQLCAYLALCLHDPLDVIVALSLV